MALIRPILQACKAPDCCMSLQSFSGVLVTHQRSGIEEKWPGYKKKGTRNMCSFQGDKN
jgi:hypothetical protein